MVENPPAQLNDDNYYRGDERTSRTINDNNYRSRMLMPNAFEGCLLVRKSKPSNFTSTSLTDSQDCRGWVIRRPTKIL